MTPDQIALVQKSFRKVVPIRAAAARMFYERLFDIEPATRSLFKHDIEAQGAKLMQALGMVVGALAHLDTVLDDMRSLGRRHVNYGVQEHHYACVGSALIWTLQTALGQSFTPETRDAWIAAYAIVSEAMMDAAREAGAKRAA